MADSSVYRNPADHPGVTGFLNQLAMSPDPLTRMRFADWLETKGYANAANAQRWAAHYGKRPVHPSEGVTLGEKRDQRFSGWIPSTSVPGLTIRQSQPFARLPQVFFNVEKNPHAKGISAARFDLPHDQRMYGHEEDFLRSSHGVKFDNEGNIISHYGPDEGILQNSDTSFPI